MEGVSSAIGHANPVMAAQGQKPTFSVNAVNVRFRGYSVAKLRPRKFRVTLIRRGAYLSKNDSFHLI